MIIERTGNRQPICKPASYLLHAGFVLLSILPINLAQGQDNNQVPARKKLTVADFKGVPDENVDYLANTNPVVSLSLHSASNCAVEGKIKLKVDTRVSLGEKTWMKVSRIKRPELLNALLSHEQGHYDLAEIFSIDLKRTLATICFDKKRYNIEVDSIYKSMFARYDTLQRRYDTETGYMRNSEMQSRWKQKIVVMFKQIQQ